MKKLWMLPVILSLALMFSSCGMIFDLLEGAAGGNDDPYGEYGDPVFSFDDTESVPVFTEDTGFITTWTTVNTENYPESDAVSALDIPGVAENSLAVDPVAQVPAYSVPVDFLIYNGNISGSGTVQSCSFEAPETGVYFCGFEMMSGLSVEVEVLDSMGKRVIYDSHVDGGAGVTCDLVKGETYKVIVSYDSGTGDYTLSVGQQKTPVDITGATSIADAIEFNNQENYYFYTPAENGTYHFYIDDINSGCVVSVYVFDSMGYNVIYDSHVSRGFGVTAELNAGETYKLAVVEYEGMGGYTLRVGPQKPTADISGYTLVADSIEFTNQLNRYSLYAPVSGVYRIELSRINSGNSIGIEVCDDQGYRVISDSYMTGGNGINAELEAGKTYTVYVVEDDGFVPYTLSVGTPREAVDISGYGLVNDSMWFKGQENYYLYTPVGAGEHSITLVNSVNGVELDVIVCDSDGYTLESEYGMSAGEDISFDADAGSTYIIAVVQDEELGAYSLELG